MAAIHDSIVRGGRNDGNGDGAMAMKPIVMKSMVAVMKVIETRNSDGNGGGVNSK